MVSQAVGPCLYFSPSDPSNPGLSHFKLLLANLGYILKCYDLLELAVDRDEWNPSGIESRRDAFVFVHKASNVPGSIPQNPHVYSQHAPAYTSPF